MEWNVEYTNEFGEWWDGLLRQDKLKASSSIDLLTERGPDLGHPHSSQIKGAKHGQMRELRVQSGGRPLRIFYAFDPRRTAILLIGGDKTGDAKFYDRMVPLADRLFDEYLIEIRKEGLIK